MSEKQPKIEIATPDEVARYAEPGASDHEPASRAAEQPEPTEAQDELTSLREQLAELQDKLLRAKAEAQNVTRRAQQEKADAIRYGNAELLKSLLAVVDDFERSLAAAQATHKVKAVVEGVRLVYEKLTKLLKDQGVEVIEAAGKPFDPTEHAAMMQQPSNEHPPGTVIQEVQRGYRYGDRVLRPAHVVVSQSTADS